MKTVIAIDSFKGSMTSIEAGNSAAEGIKRVYPGSDTVVIPDTQVQYPQDDGAVPEDNWFEELISDTGTMIVLVVVLVASFGICLALFLKLLSDKDNKHRNKK